LFDITIQELGSIEGMFEVLRANGMAPGQGINAGDEMVISIGPVDRQRYKYILQNGIRPATAFGDTAGELPDPGLGGIGYWTIETDFVVQ